MSNPPAWNRHLGLVPEVSIVCRGLVRDVRQTIPERVMWFGLKVRRFFKKRLQVCNPVCPAFASQNFRRSSTNGFVVSAG